MEWLFTQPVPREKENGLRGVPNRKGKHPVQSVNQPLPPSAPPVKQNFGIAVGLEVGARRDQLVSKTLEIVNLAIRDDGRPAARQGHRLRAAGRIDDRQPPMAERDPRFKEMAVAVGAAMGDLGRHRAQQGRGKRALAARIKESGNPTHAPSPRPHFNSAQPWVMLEPTTSKTSL